MISVNASVDYSELSRYPGIKPPMTEEELQGLCEVWQKILRLQDWKVATKFARHAEFDSLVKAGRCLMRASHKHARIVILDPLDMTPDGPFPDEPERVLVHELLHLHCAPFMPETDTPEDTAMEQAINCIADALIYLARAQP